MTDYKTPACVAEARRNENRSTYLIVEEVSMSNPNGDPDRDNLPRVLGDGRGYISSACTKHKVRNYIGRKWEGAPGHRLYISQDKALNDKHAEAFEAVGGGAPGKDKKESFERRSERAGRMLDYMFDQYEDLRLFDFMPNTGDKAEHRMVNGRGSRGAVQVSPLVSASPVRIIEEAGTRGAVTTREDFERKGEHPEMKDCAMVEYGVYSGAAYIDPRMSRARETGPTRLLEDDIKDFEEGLMRGDAFLRASGRTGVAPLLVVKIEEPDGLEPVSQAVLENLLEIRMRDEKKRCPSGMEDYTYRLHLGSLPEKEGLSVEILLNNLGRDGELLEVVG